MSIQQNINQIISSLGVMAGLGKRIEQESPEYQEKVRVENLRNQYSADIKEIKDLSEKLGYNKPVGTELEAIPSGEKKAMSERYKSAMKRIYNAKSNPINDPHLKDIDISEDELGKRDLFLGKTLPKIQTKEELFDKNLMEKSAQHQNKIQENIDKAYRNLNDNAMAELNQKRRMTQVKSKMMNKNISFDGGYDG